MYLNVFLYRQVPSVSLSGVDSEVASDIDVTLEEARKDRAFAINVACPFAIAIDTAAISLVAFGNTGNLRTRRKRGLIEALRIIDCLFEQKFKIRWRLGACCSPGLRCF